MATLTCIFGDTGSRKTTALGHAIKYMYERTGRPGRAVYTDLGNWQVIRGAMEAKLCEPFNISGEPDFPNVLHKVAQGWWPVVLENGAVPNTPEARWPRVDPWPVGVPKMKLDPVALRATGFYLFEGLTSSSELMMKYLRDKQQPMGGEAVGKFGVKDFDTGKDMLYCSNNMKHYGWVQDEMIAMLAEWAALPVERVIITAHEALGKDEDTSEAIRGPALVGAKGTGKIGKSLGDLIHFEVFPRPGGVEYRGYYQSHPDPKFPTITYKCKTRIPEAQAAALEKAFPGGFFGPADFGRFLRTSDDLLTQSTTEWTAAKAAIDAAKVAAKKEVTSA